LITGTHADSNELTIMRDLGLAVELV